VSARLQPALASVATARQLVQGAAARWGIPAEAGGDAMLVVAELVTNAVLHAGTDVKLGVRPLGPGLRVEVGDGSSRAPVLPAASPVLAAGEPDDHDGMDEMDALGALEEVLGGRSMTGRGLTLVDAVADRWGVDHPGSGGKTVWAEIGTGAAGGDRGAGSAGGTPEAGEGDCGRGGTAGGEAAVRVARLTGVPVWLVAESSTHFADLARELRVVALDQRRPPELAGLAALAREIGARLDRHRAISAAAVAAATARHDRLVDLEVALDDDITGVFARLEKLLWGLAGAATRRQLLTLPPGPDVLAYRRWYRDEVISQLSGRPPKPCPLPSAPSPAGKARRR